MSDPVRTMHARDAVSAKLASCYITIDGERYLLMQAKNLEARVEKNKVEVPILGKTGLGHRATNWNGTGSMTVDGKVKKACNTSKFAELVKRYKDTGEDIYFDIQVRNEDPTSTVGAQTVILKDCNLDSATIAAFDADGDWLEWDTDFTFEDFELPEKFADLQGMQ